MWRDNLTALLRVLPTATGDAYFQAWQGRYADSPRAISEALRAAGDRRRHIWAVPPGGTAPVEGAVAVEWGSRAQVRAIGTAGLLVSNVHLPVLRRRRRDSVYVQTWHGTPLKRLAGDRTPGEQAWLNDYVTRIRRDAATWDYLVSPNSYSTEIFRRAFAYEGRVLEVGSPRNDALVNSTAADVAAARRRLAVGDRRVVLYAPTLRNGDGDYVGAASMRAVAAELGDGYRVLGRLHPNVAAETRGETPNYVDVSMNDEINDLFLAADVLVTDYSSVMFDFATLGKPMIFYAYDLIRYRDSMRGFYIDFEHDAPGPVVRDTTALTEAILLAHEQSAEMQGRYADFLYRFCRLEDGKASERVVAALGV